MPASFASGSPALASKLSITALTRCDAPRYRSSTRRREIYAEQILLGHAKIESTVRYLGVDVEDALELAEWREV